MQKYDKKKAIRAEADLEARFVYKDFSRNHKYVEFFFTPPDHAKKGIEPKRRLEGLYGGVKGFFNQIAVNFILNHSKTSTGKQRITVFTQQSTAEKRQDQVAFGAH